MFSESQRPSSSLGDDTPQSVPGRLLATVVLPQHIVAKQTRSEYGIDIQTGD